MIVSFSLPDHQWIAPSSLPLGNEKDSDAPVVNVIIQSPRETHGNAKSNKTHASSNASDVSTSYNNKVKRTSQQQQQQGQRSNGGKQNDYAIEDVKVQISLSRLDSRSPKVYSGVWKPDTSTIQRLQGN